MSKSQGLSCKNAITGVQNPLGRRLSDGFPNLLCSYCCRHRCFLIELRRGVVAKLQAIGVPGMDGQRQES